MEEDRKNKSPRREGNGGSALLSYTRVLFVRYVFVCVSWFLVCGMGGRVKYTDGVEFRNEGCVSKSSVRQRRNRVEDEGSCTIPPFPNTHNSRPR